MSAASVVLPPPATTNLPVDGPVEAVANTPAVDYEPFLPDKKFHRTSPPDSLTLTEKQEVAYQEVLKHFASQSFVVPGLEDGDGKLTEEEKFYLVRSSILISFCFIVALNT